MAHMSGGQITECRGLCPDVPPLHAVLTILMKEDIICFFRCPGEDFGFFPGFFVFTPFADRLRNGVTGCSVRSGVSCLFFIGQLMMTKEQ
ncbi:hypothetical protein CDAR_168421 [Caerostris darwini]|uniref:Uncharacterized protein n=1 Tax=Caerostris darwini TaxID=1538125 RepID=A0AAV4T6P2_9ARAC|nr:hypothetical protein CDAR_168421 [Caerostris darwini]